LIRGRPKGQACQAAAQDGTCVSAKRHWNNRKYGASKHRLSTREWIYPKIIRNFGTRH